MRFSKIIFSLVYISLQAISVAADKFESYRPYPYLFFHGRGADAGQWGIQCAEAAEEATGFSLVHPKERDGSNATSPTCRLMESFWKNRGYAQATHDEFFRPFECNTVYRSDPATGRPYQFDWKGEVPKEEPVVTARHAPKPCRSDDFYIDFQQLSPDANQENIEQLPADMLPVLDPEKGETWDRHLSGENNDDPDFEGRILSKLPPHYWDRISFNHSFIEAYNGDGKEREVLDERWLKDYKDHKKTLVDIGRERMKEVLDEYYLNDKNQPNWACDSAKKVILVGYSTGASVIGGIIYHDQELLKQGVPINSWCKDGKPTPGNEQNARELLSQHVAFVVGHNPVVAGSHHGEYEANGYAVRQLSLPLLAPGFLYLAFKDGGKAVNALFGPAGSTTLAVFKGLNIYGTGLSGVSAIGGFALYKFKTETKDKLAEDLGYHSDYFKRLRGYGVPPVNALTLAGPKEKRAYIEYKTVATRAWAWSVAVDMTLSLYLAAEVGIGLFTGQWDNVVAGGLALAGMSAWWEWNHGSDAVLEYDESITSGKALHPDAKIQHTVLRNIAHASPGPFPAKHAYPFHPEVWDALRGYVVDPPQLQEPHLVQHKCVNNIFDKRNRCDDLPGDIRIDPTTKTSAKSFHNLLSRWQDANGASNQSSRPLSDGEGLIRITEGQGAPLAIEGYYRSNLMASDRVEGYINGAYFPLKFRKDFGAETHAKTNSARFRIPLTLGPGAASYGIPEKWVDLFSGLQNGGNIVGFRGVNSAGSTQKRWMIYYDKYGITMNPMARVYDGKGLQVAEIKDLNLGSIRWSGNDLREVQSDKVLFGYWTNLKPKAVRVTVHGTGADGEIDKSLGSAIYQLDRNRLPGSGREIYDPYSNTAQSGRVYLSPRKAGIQGEPDAHQLFFWVKKSDLLRNKDRSLEGLKHITLLLEKEADPGQSSNETQYQIECAVDNSAPKLDKVYSPTLVRRINGKSYSDRDGDGTLVKELLQVCSSDKGYCYPENDGVDNDGKNGIDDPAESRDILIVSQGRDRDGKPLSTGFGVRFTLTDNLQSINAFAPELRWGISSPTGGIIHQSQPRRYEFGKLFHDYFPIPKSSEMALAEGLYEIWYKVKDLAGNERRESLTHFVVDNSAPKIRLVSEAWKGNASGKAGVLLRRDSHIQSMVITDE